MSKSTSMLPTLAGGSGVLAHTVTDSDLMKIVDSVTANANRDRKITVAELRAAINVKSAFYDLTSALTATTTWNGVALTALTIKAATLARDYDGLYRLRLCIQTPTAPGSWAVSDTTSPVKFTCNPGSPGFALWTAFVNARAAEMSTSTNMLEPTQGPRMMSSGGTTISSVLLPNTTQFVPTTGATPYISTYFNYYSVGPCGWFNFVPQGGYVYYTLNLETVLPA